MSLQSNSVCHFYVELCALQPFYLFFSAHAWREDHVEVLGARLYQTIKQNETNNIDFFPTNVRRLLVKTYYK